MLDDGTIDFDTPDFTLTLARSSQTAASLTPKGAPGFDFTPGDLLVARSQNGYHHLGDLELRVRRIGGDWKSYSTAVARAAPSRRGSNRAPAVAAPAVLRKPRRSSRRPPEGSGGMTRA